MSEKQKILVVDDDVQLVDTVKTLLEGAGYSVSHAYHSEKGMELAREIKPDLILLDIMFAGPPGADGVEISRRLRADPALQDTPVIMLSGVKKVLDMPVKLAPDECRRSWRNHSSQVSCWRPSKKCLGRRHDGRA
jgi:CheY-like chemotaxis protein